MRRLIPFILVFALIVLGGCGSSSSSTSSDSIASSETESSETSAEGPLTKAEYIAAADADCKLQKAAREPLQAKVKELARKARAEEQSKDGLSATTRRELAQTLRQIDAIAEDGYSRRRALGVPKADADQLEAILVLGESAVVAAHVYAAALETHEDSKAQAILEKGDALTRESASLSKQYGFKVCGSQP